MAEYADVFLRQSEIGKETERMLVNFKKDSISRKTREYLQKRLVSLDALWLEFKSNHDQIVLTPEEEKKHPYFANKFYDECNTRYRNLKDMITSMQQGLNEQPVPSKSKSSTLNSSDHDTERKSVANSEVLRLIKRQKALMSTITHLLQGIEDQGHIDQSLSYYELKLQLLNQYENDVRKNNEEIWESAEAGEFHEYTMELYHTLYDWLQDTIILLHHKLRNLKSTDESRVQPTLVAPSTTLNLPKITLPTFDGNYLNWTQFRELYTQLIHHNNTISDAQKMFYLVANLSGEARGLIHHLPVSTENYDAAWTIVYNRYDNKRLLVTAFLNKLLSQPNYQIESAASIKALHDTTKECLLGLKNLGIDIDSWDPILVHLLIKKFDKTTHTLFEQSLTTPKELISINKLLDFLETRFQSLEAIGTRNFGTKSNLFNKATSLVNTRKPDNHCILCKQNHSLYTCSTFLAKSPSKRYQLVRDNNLCINCLRQGHIAANCTLRSCTKCNKKHNSLLHPDDKLPQRNQLPPKVNSEAKPTVDTSKARDNPVSKSITLSVQRHSSQTDYVLLSTIVVSIIGQDGKTMECRAILDSGSQLNFITDKLARKLSLKESKEEIRIRGIGQKVQQAYRRVNITIKSKINEFTTNMEAHILPQITEPQPTTTIDVSKWSIPNNIQLADPQFAQPQRIDLLIGAENYFEFLSIGQIKLGKGHPMLQNTVFGWIVAGKVRDIPSSEAICGICTHDEGKLEDQVEKFWKLEDGDQASNPLTQAEIQCEDHYNQHVQRHPNGRYVVKLPFLKDPSALGDSKEVALARLRSVERKLRSNPGLKAAYVEFMKEYEELGHMEKIDYNKITKPHYFLPHHCVIKPDSTTTKVRVVFDASAKTSSNISLNNVLHTGPKLQDELLSILLRFRFPQFVFTADIEKMYRQILIHPNDRKYQLIWWRENEQLPIKCYQLTTVTYGVTTAPYLAIKCLQRVALENKDKAPLGSTCLKRDFYVDDLMTGSDSLTQSLEMQHQVNKILSAAGFKLRKWCANHPALLRNIPPEDRALQVDIGNDDNCTIKTLGLLWHPHTDEFQITTMTEQESKVTKRKILSDIAHLFDPLGVMSPIVITAKLILQNLWALKLNWDAAIPMELHCRWMKFRESLKLLNNIKIPRHVIGGSPTDNMQLHVFCDASEKAYGVVVYVRSVHNDGIIRVRLLCAKSRVAPVKQVTLPRLELCGAKLAAELLDRVKKDLQWQHPCYLWTDSSIVLGWINSQSTNYQTFVANRVATIQKLTMATQWRHVPSKVNPADLVSRGMQPDKFKECSLWFYGPLFLSGPESRWPSTPTGVEPDLEKRRSKVCLTISEERQALVAQIDHHNSWKRLQRIVAYMVRFTSNSRERDYEKRQLDTLTVDELSKATKLIIKETQEEGFPEDVADLRKHGSINSSSSLASLQPFIDQNGLIRVGGRLAEVNLSYDAKHPILLPYNHIITRLIFIDNHIDNAHIGPQGLLSTIRQRFWPVKGKTTARNVVQNCVRCARVKPKLLTQLMGNLPSTRVQPGRPFINTGVDFCGPFWTHLKIRGKKPLKSYVAVFCCFSTKAIHLEVVSDLTTESFIGALKRFVGRRGYCRNIYCDNATNFVGARNQLTELQDTIYSSQAKERISTFCTSKNIDFHFIPPRAPHFGGLWEAAVKSAKHLFQKSLAAAALTYEELSTAMVEIEAILNSRPLTPMSNDPNDLAALTPGHFLIGEPLTALVDPHANPTKGNLLYRWKLVSQLKTEFWHRWRKEYLSELQYRHKWTKINDNVEPGLMVVLKEDNVPVLSWPLGRIINVIKGNDGLARVVDVKTATGIFRRPIARLAPLPIETGIEEQKCLSQEAESMKKPPSDADSKHEETQPRKRRRMGGLNPVNLFLVTCFLLPLIVFGQITVKPFNNQPGLYFEGMGTTKLTSSDWNLVVYFNMNPYWKELEFLSHGVNQLQAICRSKLDHTACNDTVIQFLRVIAEINNTNELLSEHPPGRRRRSPFNFVGSIARSLFGVLDSTYAEDMSKIITNVGNNQDHLMMLIKNQTTLIDSTTNVIQKSQEGIQKQVTEFNQRINQTIIAVNNIESEIQRQNILEVFNELSMRLFLTISHFQRMQSVLLDVVSHAHHGKVNPILLTPKQLREQLAVIKDHLPPNLQIPAANSQLLELYQLMAIKSRITSTKIIFRLQLPLLMQETFEMFHLVPIPTMINQTFLILKTRSTYLITNLHRDVFYPLSGEELSQCYLMKNSVHVCKLNHLLGRKNTQQDACELNLLTQSSTPPACTFIPLERVPRWTQLLATNQWMYVTNEETIVNVMCGHTLNRTTISGAGIMTITQGCIVTDEATTIHSHNIVSTSLAASFVPTKNITANLPTKELTRLLLPPIDQLNITDDINALRQRIKELQTNENLEPINALHKVHHLTVSYACLSAVTIIMIWLIWKRCNIRPHKSHPTPAHRQEGGDFEFQTTA